ncbi:ribonuclease H-like domain-containing protein [Tanacetum coccineum]
MIMILGQMGDGTINCDYNHNGRIFPPTTQEEQFADEKERKARTLLLMAVPKDHLRRFHGMDDAKEIWSAIKTRFGLYANSKKMQKAVLKNSLKAMTMRTKKKYTLVIMILDNNLSVFEQDIQKTSSSSQASDNVAFLSQAKASSSKHKPSHSSGNQNDDLDLEEMDINWQIAMTAIKIKKFYKKTGRRPRVDGKMHVAFDKRKVECFNCHNTGHFARECKFKGSKEGSRQEACRGQDFKPVRTEKEALMTIDEGRSIGVNVNTGHGNVNSVSSAGTQFKCGASRFNTGKQHVNSGSVHVNSGHLQFIPGASRFNTGKQHVSSVRVNIPVSNTTSPKPSKWALPVRPQPGYVGDKHTTPSNTNSGPTPDSNVNIKCFFLEVQQGRPSPVRPGCPLDLQMPDEASGPSKGIGHRWMFDLDYLTDSMNYIPVSVQNQANPAGSKEVIDIDVQTEEAAELMVITSTSLTEATRKAVVSEEIATKKTHSPKQPSSITHIQISE